ncbi:MAG: NmrA family NAD(P)-binding protein [Anaerolineae bacterium]|nr:NmrA family NAD(P)-binding protein [Anaerolineae bacterium]
MILITGAAGKTGRAIIRTLVSRKQSVRALVRRPEQAQPVQELGVREVVTGDLRDPAAVGQAARGSRAIYHICPNMHPDEAAIGQVAIAAAQSAGVQHFVYHSVLHPQIEAMPHHWLKMRVEEQLFKSGLSYTILQPAAYMQNVLAQWDRIVQEGVYPVPYRAETRLGMVDLDDVAEAAAVVLTEGGHAGATYELASAEALSQIEVALVLAGCLGQPVRAQTVEIETWKQQARASGLGSYQIETLVKMFQYYEQHGFWGNPRVLGWLLGRPPTTFAAFCRRASKAKEQGGRN